MPSLLALAIAMAPCLSSRVLDIVYEEVGDAV